MRILIAPDKFKGSLNSFELAEHLRVAALRSYPNAAIQLFPLADGGDGFAAIIKHYLHTQSMTTPTVNALGEAVTGTFEWSPDTTTAFIEMAVASGLASINAHDRDALWANTIGTGRLVARALELGASRINLGAGGSATTDAGTGILYALGFSFYNSSGQPIIPCGVNLAEIQQIDPPSSIPQIEWVIAADVTNPMYGPSGAAHVFGPQKGATKGQVDLLDEGLRHFAKIIHQHTGRDISEEPGMGAAGAVAAGLSAFFPVSIRSGADMLIDMSGMPDALPAADLLVTGEGKFDEQSLDGKLVMKVAEAAIAAGSHVLVVCGELSIDEATLKKKNISAIAIRDKKMSLDESIWRAGELVEAIDIKQALNATD